MPFQTIVHAKCILAGEHTVLQGGAALVSPVASKTLKMTYEDSDQLVDITTSSPHGEVFDVIFWGTFQKALHRLNKKISNVHGHFEIENNIEMGAGLGFSAALSVVITRWLIWEQWLKEKKMYEFSHNLEEIFHGKSSGVDIAGALSDHVLHFERSGKIYLVKTNWQPKLYLSYSGSLKITKIVIDKINTLRKHHPSLAKKIDEEMRESVFAIEEALKQNQEQGLTMLIAALEHAKHCFELWGLVTPKLQRHIDQLHNLGAVAVKPTGAGYGGYVLSLWKTEPPLTEDIKFIPVTL